MLLEVHVLVKYFLFYTFKLQEGYVKEKLGHSAYKI